jgi:hypothetical protein
VVGASLLVWWVHRYWCGGCIVIGVVGASLLVWWVHRYWCGGCIVLQVLLIPHVLVPLILHRRTPELLAEICKYLRRSVMSEAP